MIIDRTTRKPCWEQRDDAWGMQHDCEILPNGHITLTSVAIRARSTQKTQTGTGPNQALHLTASSVCSSVARASGSR
jgi:hypothetical protein